VAVVADGRKCKRKLATSRPPSVQSAFIEGDQNKNQQIRVRERERKGSIKKTKLTYCRSFC
jgi:hypothetical protein